MAEFFTVTKGGQTREVVGQKQLAQAQAEGWELGGTKRVRTETGEKTLGTGEALDRAATGTADIVSEEEILARRGEEFLEEKFGGEGIQTFGESALSSLTFGAFDPGDLAGLTEGDAGAAAARARVNRGAATAGAVTGAVVGSLAPGGLAKVLPGGIAARAATRAGKAIRGATGSKVAGLVAEGAADGALFGAGQAYANAVIADKPVNVENIIGSMSSEALYGGALGGAIGAAVGGLGKLSRKIKTSERTAARASEDLKRLSSEALDTSDDLARATKAAQDATEARRSSKLAAKEATTAANSADDTIRTAAKFSDDVSGTPGLLDLEPSEFTSSIKKAIEESPELAEAAAQKFARAELPRLSPEELAIRTQELGIPTPAGPVEEMLTQAYVTRRSIDEISLAAAKSDKAAQAAHSTELAAQATGAKNEAALANKLKRSELTRARQDSGSVGPLESALSSRLGGMYRAIQSGRERIKTGVTRFIKAAGKPRKGTSAAAATALGNIRFDPVGPKSRAAKTNKRAHFKRISGELETIARNPEVAKQRISESLGEINALKPGMAAALSQKAFQRAMYLHGLLPRDPVANGFAPSSWEPSNTEIDKFARIAAAAEDPYSILDDMQGGQLTQESVDTVKALYPEIYHEIQMELVQNAEVIKQKVGYTGRLQLGVMFQAPTDPSLQPDFIQLMQSNYAARAAEQEQAGGGDQFSTPGSNQKAIASTATASQRLEVAD